MRVRCEYRVIAFESTKNLLPWEDPLTIWHRFSKYCYAFSWESDEFNDVFQFLEPLLPPPLILLFLLWKLLFFLSRVIFSLFLVINDIFLFFFFFFFSLSFPRIVKLYRWVYIREHGRKDSWPCLLPVGLSAGRRKEQGATGAETFRMVIVLGLAQDRSCTLKLRITRGPKGWPFSRLVYEQQSWSFRTLGAAGSRRMDD